MKRIIGRAVASWKWNIRIGIIRDMDTRRLDLNLLLVLEVLLSEASVTGAARRLHLAQPTVSNALARLREHFGDSLLVRSGRAMRLTPKARQLMSALRDALTAIERTLGGDAVFDASTSDRTFRIATTDYVSMVLLPGLLGLLGREAPGIRIAVTEPDTTSPYQMLRRGEVDLLLGSMNSSLPGVQSSALFADRYVCLMRRDHPRIGRRITQRQFLGASHIAIRHQHGGASGLIDEMLRRRSEQRRIAVSMPHLLAAPAALLASESVLTVGARVAAVLQREFPLKALPHPMPLQPFVVYQAWHQCTNQDAGHGWLRSVLRELAVQLPRKPA